MNTRKVRAGMPAPDDIPWPEPRNQCGETCERAKLCAACARELAESTDSPTPVVESDK